MTENNAIATTIEDGYAVIVYPNELNTVTVAVINDVFWNNIQNVIDTMPEEQITDVASKMLTDAAITKGVARARQKMNDARSARLAAAHLRQIENEGIA